MIRLNIYIYHFKNDKRVAVDYIIIDDCFFSNTQQSIFEKYLEYMFARRF